jgi:hypothetical protein
VELQITVSSPAVARRVSAALEQLGHTCRDEPSCPGLVLVRLCDPADAPLVHRIAAMLDHPAAVAA